MLIFIDDFLCYIIVYFIKFKSEVFLKFIEYVNFVDKYIGYQIMKLNIFVEEDVKVLRSDNGGEYIFDKFIKFCVDKGILYEFIVLYCLQ